MRIVLGCDHAGFKMKKAIKVYLVYKGYKVDDVGAFNTKLVDYPMIGAMVAKAVIKGKNERGILVCGSGEGMCIVANRFQGIRAALASTLEHAQLSRRHNDANVLCLGERLTTINQAYQITDIFLDTAFEGGRHQRRINQIEEVSGKQ